MLGNKKEEMLFKLEFKKEWRIDIKAYKNNGKVNIRNIKTYFPLGFIGTC